MHDPITPPPQITTRMGSSAGLLFETGSSDVASLYISEASRLTLIVIKRSAGICVAPRIALSWQPELGMEAKGSRAEKPGRTAGYDQRAAIVSGT